MSNSECAKVQNRIFEYIDGELKGEDKSAFEEHLSVCADCRKELSLFRETIALVGESAYQPTVDLAAAFIGTVNERKAPKRRLYMQLGGVAAAAALLMVIFLGRDIYEKAFDMSNTAQENAPFEALYQDISGYGTDTLDAEIDETIIERSQPADITVKSVFTTGNDAIPDQDNASDINESEDYQLSAQANNESHTEMGEANGEADDITEYKSYAVKKASPFAISGMMLTAEEYLSEYASDYADSAALVYVWRAAQPLFSIVQPTETIENDDYIVYIFDNTPDNAQAVSEYESENVAAGEIHYCQPTTEQSHIVVINILN